MEKRLIFDVLTQFVTGFVVALSGALIPGPLLLFTITQTMKNTSKYAGLLAGLGHCTVEAFIIIVIILGLTQLFDSILFQFLVNIIGGIALIVFGILSILEIDKKQLEQENSRTSYNSFF